MLPSSLVAAQMSDSAGESVDKNPSRWCGTPWSSGDDGNIPSLMRQDLAVQLQNLLAPEQGREGNTRTRSAWKRPVYMSSVSHTRQHYLGPGQSSAAGSPRRFMFSSKELAEAVVAKVYSPRAAHRPDWTRCPRSNHLNTCQTLAMRESPTNY